MRLATFVLALIPQTALAQKVEPVAPAAMLRHVTFGEVIQMPPAFAGVAAPTNSSQNAGGYLAEYLPPGEGLGAWTRLQTLTANPGPGAQVPDARAPGVARDTVERLRALYRNACTGVVDTQDLPAPAIPGARATAAVWVGCGDVNRSGFGEDVVALILVTPLNTVSLQLATRGAAVARGVPRDPADWQARLDFLSSARACTPPPGEAAPYASCN